MGVIKRMRSRLDGVSCMLYASRDDGVEVNQGDRGLGVEGRVWEEGGVLEHASEQKMKGGERIKERKPCGG